MAAIESAIFDIGRLETLAGGDTAIHRLDPRIKLLTGIFFVVTVVSFGKYTLSALLIFFLFPVSMLLQAQLPPLYLLKKLALALPFVFFVGIFNPVLDREVLFYLGPLGISGGWVSFLSILLRFTLTVLTVFILIATTGVMGLSMALEKLGVPNTFATQLLFLYRYLFILVAEAGRLVRARALRSFDGRGLGWQVTSHMVGHLLLRTLNRARRIHLAMLSRGFTGEIRLTRPVHLGAADIRFLIFWCSFFTLMRLFDLPRLLGELLLGIYS